MLAPWKKSYDKLRQCIKKQRHHFTDKSLYSQSYGSSSTHVWMSEVNHKEDWAKKKEDDDWAPKNWCFWTVVLEKTPESPLNCKEIKPVNHKGNQAWIFIVRTDTEALILWPPNAKSQLIRKDPDAGKDGRQEEKGKTEDKMVGWHHWLNGHEFEQAPGDGEGQGRLVCCSPRTCKESDMSEPLNNNTLTTILWNTLRSFIIENKWKYTNKSP